MKYAKQGRAGGTGGRFVVLSANDKSFVSRFESHEDAIADVVQRQSATGEKFVIRKMA
jgi:hypothetical protein